MSVELSDQFLTEIAGWQPVKQARAYLAQGQVVSSNYSPPLLRGVVRVGEIFFRASIVFKSESDIENLCTCREAREGGQICSHVVAVGLHWLMTQRREAAPAPVASPSAAATTVPVKPTALARKPSALGRDPEGLAVELTLILPPNFDQALARGKVTLVVEGKWAGGQGPLTALSKGRTYAFDAADTAILDQLEIWSGGEIPTFLQMEAKDFTTLLPLLVEYPRVKLGRATAVKITRTPYPLPVQATLEKNGEITVAVAGKLTALVRV
ncbi:MAG TPA: hypothetical protein VF607_00605, partial [Verrucomicrobiae bacterium]